MAATHTDVVIAEVGATAAFAGLVLVFLGILVSTYQTLLGKTTQTTLDRFRRASRLSLGVFVVALAGVAVSTCWLIVGGGDTFYGITLGLFFLELAALTAVAVYATARVLLR
jgi:hypothetical protein